MVLGKMSGNHLGQPHNVPDLLLLQLYVGVKHSHLVALVESQCVAVSLLVVHDVVQRFLIHVEVLLLGRVRRFVDQLSVPRHSLYGIFQVF